MGITVDFLLKHVRPLGAEAALAVCHPDGELARFLRGQGVLPDAVRVAFAAWTRVAQQPLDGANVPEFVGVATRASVARRAELYPVPRSTMLFLTDALLRELSYVSALHPGRAFDFSPHEHIPLAVTWHGNGTVDVLWNLTVARLAADEHGNCIHFSWVE